MILRILSILGLIVLLLGAARASAYDPWQDLARYELEYRFQLDGHTAGSTKSMRLWISLPADTECQEVLEQDIDTPWPWQSASDNYGNRLIYLEPQPGQSGQVVMRFVVRRTPRSTSRPKIQAEDLSTERSRFLRPQRLVPIDGRIRELADQQCAGLQDDEAKIRAVYDYVLETMRYSKEDQGWGRGDALWACDSKYGNCTDFHSLLIGMVRSQGIPARFIIGFPIPTDRGEGKINGYHCWAEVNDRRKGWTPIDASEAWKSKKVEAYFGRLPSDRIEFTAGRDLLLKPKQQGPPLNYFIYPYLEVQGKPADTIQWRIRFNRLEPGD